MVCQGKGNCVLFETTRVVSLLPSKARSHCGTLCERGQGSGLIVV